MGIDTWESRTRDLEEKAKGLKAKARNKELLEGGNFKLISHGTGKFGRVLGEMYVGDKNINLMMVDDHLAVKYKGQNKKEIEKEHIVNRDILIAKGSFDPKTVEKE